MGFARGWLKEKMTEFFDTFFDIPVPLWQWIVSQIIGVFLIVANIFGWQQKDKIRLLWFLVILNILALAANIFLFNWVVVALGSVGAVKNLSFIFVETKRRARVAGAASKHCAICTSGGAEAEYALEVPLQPAYALEAGEITSKHVCKADINSESGGENVGENGSENGGKNGSESGYENALQGEKVLCVECSVDSGLLTRQARKDMALSVSLLVFFTIANVVTLYLTMAHPFDWVIIAGRIVGNYAIWSSGIHRAKLLGGLQFSSIMLVNALMFTNVMGVIMEIVIITSILTFYIRLLKNRGKKKEQT